VAVANDPTVLLADEPTGEVDSVTGQRVLGLLEERARRGVAVVVVTHSEVVAAAADRVVTLADGRVLA
jgi:putative ABC transport system ATP-binding protein